MKKDTLSSRIATVGELESLSNVETGDLVICTYNVSPFETLDIATGLYNPYQGVDGEMLAPGVVDLSYGARQRSDLVKSNDCFRVHLIGQTYGDMSKIVNISGFQTQIPVEKVFDFKVMAKAEEISDFFRNSVGLTGYGK